MSIEDFIINVFCVIDDKLKKVLRSKKLRQRGRYPTLTDSEVITMEIVGEFLGKDCDKSIWEYFKSHWRHFFPEIPDRSNFVRQAANLHMIKRMLQERLTIALGSLAEFWRKLLAHTVCVKINMEKGNEPLQFERLITC